MYGVASFDPPPFRRWYKRTVCLMAVQAVRAPTPMVNPHVKLASIKSSSETLSSLKFGDINVIMFGMDRVLIVKNT